MREMALYRFSQLSFVLLTQFLKHIKFLLVFWANRPLNIFNQQLKHNMLIIIIININIFIIIREFCPNSNFGTSGDFERFLLS